MKGGWQNERGIWRKWKTAEILTKYERKKPAGRPKSRFEDNVEIYLK
jgi:hypothetical protein